MGTLSCTTPVSSFQCPFAVLSPGARRLARRGRAENAGTPAGAAAHLSFLPFLDSPPFLRPSSIRHSRNHSRATPSCTHSSVCGLCRTAFARPFGDVPAFLPVERIAFWVCNRPQTTLKRLQTFVRLRVLVWVHSRSYEKLTRALSALCLGSSDPPHSGARAPSLISSVCACLGLLSWVGTSGRVPTQAIPLRFRTPCRSTGVPAVEMSLAQLGRLLALSRLFNSGFEQHFSFEIDIAHAHARDRST
eukprot:scaffold38683_cov53-Phaeocystis_antarctica.AAC.1